MTISKEIFKNILKINWFKYEWRKYTRDDWIYIEVVSAWNYVIVDWEGEITECNSQWELIWWLALYGVINRLF